MGLRSNIQAGKFLANSQSELTSIGLYPAASEPVMETGFAFLMRPASQRLQPYLDWTRGAAALVMLQGHVFNSFLRNDLRDGDGAYAMSQFARRHAATPYFSSCWA